MDVRTTLAAATLSALIAISTGAGDGAKQSLEDVAEPSPVAAATTQQFDLFSNAYDVSMDCKYHFFIIPIPVRIAGTVGEGRVDLRIDAVFYHYRVKGEYRRGEPVNIPCHSRSKTFGADGSFDGSQAQLESYQVVDGKRVHVDTIAAAIKQVEQVPCPGGYSSCLDLTVQIQTEKGVQESLAHLRERSSQNASYAVAK
jgi:hypothetical protein